MAPAPSKLRPRAVPGTEWTSFQLINDVQMVKDSGGVFIEPNIDTTCFSIRSVNENGDEDLIHFCDWPALRATIDQFMADRAKEADDE